MDSKQRTEFLLSAEDIERIKREGIERNAVRNETFCRVLKNLGYKFFRNDNGDGVGGVYNESTCTVVEFNNEDEYVDWLEEQRRILKPWINNIAESLIKENRNIVFLLDFDTDTYTKLYNLNVRGWNDTFESAVTHIKEICEEHHEELVEGKWIYIADRVGERFEPRYRAIYLGELQRKYKNEYPYGISAVNFSDKKFFNEIVNGDPKI